ncbi:MAG TPA: chemotaxis protein CheB [Nocardioidaceae bacterium]|nr:chemotaxis protein CheB [Nocardioidaceae bacterium]
MGRREIVVIGASAGGIEPVKELIAALPADLGGIVLVVIHLPADGETALPQILDREAKLPVALAKDGDSLQPGKVLVAPPGQHLMVIEDSVSLSSGPRESGFRPAIDVLFRSAAMAHGPRVIGVILSGALDDGAAGMVAIRLRGGVGIVQDPGDAQHSSMPRAAIDAAVVEHVVPVVEIPRLLLELTGEELPASDVSESALIDIETTMIAQSTSGADTLEPPGRPAGLVCPDCSGPLYEISEGRLTRYRCRVGHAWSPLSLASQQSTEVEDALWTAAETLEEKAILRERLGSRARADGRDATAQEFLRAAEAARETAMQIRRLIEDAVTDSEPGGRAWEQVGH